MRILAISGSLRRDSWNTRILRALGTHFAEDVEYELFEDLERIPPFNPDLDDPEHPHEIIRKWRDRIRDADALVIASPEYAHTISGVLKNALEWVVASGELVDKPVAAINVSPTHLGADKAHEALKYTLRLLSANLLEEASFCLGAVNRKVDDQDRITDSETRERVRKTGEMLLALKGVGARKDN